MVDILALRDLLMKQNPFILGKYPHRLAPAHVLNGFVVASLGGSKRGVAVRVLLAHADPITADVPSIRTSSWAKDGATLLSAREDMNLVLNPDRRSWKDMGSLVPLDPHISANDGSDDRFGSYAWSLVRENDKKGAEALVQKFFVEESSIEDPATVLARILADGAVLETPGAGYDASASWFGPSATPAGVFVRKSFADFLGQLMSRKEDLPYPTALQYVGRATYLITYLATLYGSVASNATEKISGVDELMPLVVFGGLPPGVQGGLVDGQMVNAASRSFKSAVARHRSGLATTLFEAMKAQRLPRAIPENKKTSARLAALLQEASVGERRRREIEEAADALPKCDAHSGVDLVWCDRAIDAFYPSDKVTTGLRSMGRKVGLAGPDRGAGVPRFLMETQLLGTLVMGLCPPGESLPLPEFVDLCRTRLGLVLGMGSGSKDVGGENLWPSRAMGQKQLRTNEEWLRDRLIRGGLATQYSDGRTEVRSDAS